MLLRDFWYLDWENRYYVIHAGDHIRLRRVEAEEYQRELEKILDYLLNKRRGIPLHKQGITYIDGVGYTLT